MEKLIVYTKTRDINLFNLTPEDIDIKDISSSLSKINRFNGHTIHPYSVALHSIIGSYMVSEKNALYFLLHDAHEVYTQDIIKPIKDSGIVDTLLSLSEKVQRMIHKKFGLDMEIPTEVGYIDKLLNNIEFHVLVRNLKTGLTFDDLYDYKVDIMFMNRYKELTNGK